MAIEKPWGGRFAAQTDEAVERFTASIEADARIALDDIEGSTAHARMLGEAGLISAADAEALIRGLAQVRQEVVEERFEWKQSLEDVHMNIETRLGQLVSADVAGRLHTARSRNDQVALDERLFLRRRLQGIAQRTADLERALVAQGQAHVDTLLPGYTHLQRAQPVRLAHHLLAYREMLARDRLRIRDLLARADVSPLGSGALAATPHPIARARVAELLGFAGVTRNSLDAVSDHDALLDAMSASAIAMIHLSRLAEDLIIWSSYEFRFCEIGDAFTTGSSMMPQKKNPDVAELIRGKVGRVIGDLVALLVTMKALPLSYNRDMQEDKPALIDSLDTWEACVDVMARMIPAVRFRPDRMRAALDEGFVLATELADHLVQRGVPFREAHHAIGKLVGDCAAQNKRLEDLSIAELRAYHAAFGDDARDWLDAERAVDRRDVPGGPARRQVLAELERAARELAPS